MLKQFPAAEVKHSKTLFTAALLQDLIYSLRQKSLTSVFFPQSCIFGEDYRLKIDDFGDRVPGQQQWRRSFSGWCAGTAYDFNAVTLSPLLLVKPATSRYGAVTAGCRSLRRTSCRGLHHHRTPPHPSSSISSHVIAGCQPVSSRRSGATYDSCTAALRAVYGSIWHCNQLTIVRQ